MDNYQVFFTSFQVFGLLRSIFFYQRETKKIVAEKLHERTAVPKHAVAASEPLQTSSGMKTSNMSIRFQQLPKAPQTTYESSDMVRYDAAYPYNYSQIAEDLMSDSKNLRSTGNIHSSNISTKKGAINKSSKKFHLASDMSDPSIGSPLIDETADIKTKNKRKRRIQVVE